VLRVDPRTDEVTRLGGALLPAGGWKWHGGVAGPDGCVYGVPAHAGRVLKVDVGEGRPPAVRLIGEEVERGRHRPDGRYKYGGAVLGGDGRIYCLPSDADRVLRVDPATEEVVCVGPPGGGGGGPAAHNQWQNGYLARDGCVYAIPCNARGVLRIDCATQEVSTVGALGAGFEKWEGGVVGLDGAMYCIPQNAKRVMRIVPGPPPS